MKKTNQTGFSIVEALLILVVVGILGFTGWYVYHAKQTSDKSYSAASNSTAPTYKKKTTTTKTATANPYAGWNTCDDTADGVSFKYPSGWTVQGSTAGSNPCSGFTLTAGQEFSLRSPSSNGLAFTLIYFPGQSKTNLSKSNSSTNGDSQKVQSASPLTLSSGKTVSLVSYVNTDTTSSTDGLISDMALTDQSYSVGKTFHVIDGITSPKASSYSVIMEASLAPPGSQDVRMYTPAQYQTHPSYTDLMNIFKSIAY